MYNQLVIKSAFIKSVYFEISTFLKTIFHFSCMILKSMFFESSTFSKTIFDFLFRFPVIFFLRSVCEPEIMGDLWKNGRFFFENVLFSEYTYFTGNHARKVEDCFENESSQNILTLSDELSYGVTSESFILWTSVLGFQWSLNPTW